MVPYIAEFAGTTILLFLINCLVANVTLNKSGMKGGGSVQIAFDCGFAVMTCAFIFGNASGAHFNPAYTIAMAVNGTFAWGMVPGYIVAQLAGAVLGACFSYALFKDHFDATEDKDAIRGVFCTSPSIRNLPRNLLSEIGATFILVFGIMGMANVPGLPPGTDKLFLCGIITLIGMTFGGLTGFAINPARDLGPRIAHAILPIKNKGDSDWGYAWVPVVGPVLGGLLAVLVFQVIPWG